jgi:hypothetical protein
MTQVAGENMNQEEEYNRILDGLLIGVDMADEVSRKLVYNSCLTYAQQELDADPDVNLFIALAAKRLGQVRVHFGVVKSIVPMPEKARLHLRYAPQGGPTLTGNADGLRYLSDLCAALADSPTSNDEGPEEHVHLYENEPPMFGQSYGLTIYHSSDGWFDRHAVAPDDAEGDEDAPAAPSPPREVAPESVVALEFFEDHGMPLPPPVYLRFDKLYRVLDQRIYDPEDKVWAKRISEEEDGRMHIFAIRDDAQERFEIALHLDDPSIHYFTRSDLEQVWEVVETFS